MGRLPGRGGRRRGERPSVDPRRAGCVTVFRAVPRCAGLVGWPACGRRWRGDRARRAWRARLHAPPGANQGQGPRRRVDPVRLRGLRPPAPRRAIAARRPARGASLTARRHASPGPARPPERAHRDRRDRVLRGRPCPGSRGDHGQGPPLAVRARKRTDRWQKVKIRPEQELIVGGWLEGQGPGDRARCAARRRLRGRGAAVRGQGRRGFHEREPSAELLAAVGALATDAPPFASPPPRAAARDAHWLRPELVIRAEFAGWTGDGLVRQAAFKGLDLEKDPRRVIRERPKGST